MRIQERHRSQAAKVLLLAAGLGKRLGPLTDRTPKCLIPVAGRPLLDYWFERFKEAGLRQIMINTHHHRDRVREYVASINSAQEFDVRESYEPRLLGSAGTIRNNFAFADEVRDVFLIYADNLSTVDLDKLLEYHHSHVDPLTIMLYRAPDPSACGIAVLDDAARVVAFEEKPKHPTSDLANAGVYVVSRDAYREIAAMNAFDIAYDVLPKFLCRMRGWIFDGYHQDVGSPAAYERAQLDARRIFPEMAQERIAKTTA